MKNDLINKKIKVLDDGFIRIIDLMGDDSAIVQAARVSYGEGTKRISEDNGLIRYLMRNQHTSPFEMCEIKLHVRVPMDVWRQWIRHRTANVNEYSTRYSIAIDASHKTNKNEWRLQSGLNKQGSSDYIDEEFGRDLSSREKALQELSRDVYNERIKLGIAREQARKDLPLSTYTEAYWKIDLHNLLHFLKLRMDQHAQYEIRQYANIIGNEVVKLWCPLTWQAFEDYELNSIKLSRIEIEIIRLLFANQKQELKKFLESNNLISQKNNKNILSRELNELIQKLERLHINFIDFN